MKIWLVNAYALPPGCGGSERHVAMARGLIERGHTVTVVAGSFNHFTGEEHSLSGRQVSFARGASCCLSEDGLRFCVLPVRPYRGNGLGRFWNMLSFCLSLLKLGRAVKAEDRPDVLVGSSLHLFGAWGTWWIARRWKRAFVLEIRDIWPETLVDLYGWRTWHPFVLINRWVADFLYRSSVEIVTTLPLAEPHFRERGALAPVSWIPNGCRIGSTVEEASVREDRPFVLTYAGSLSAANALEELLEACRILRTELTRDRLVVQMIGDGPLGEELRRWTEEQGLDFFRFRGRLEREETQACLRESDGCVLMIQNSPIYRWGFSMNKFADYLASGRPLIIADVCPYRPVSEAQCGLSYRAGDAGDLARAIRALVNSSPAERMAMGDRARQYAREYFDWRILAGRMEAVLLRAVASRREAQAKKVRLGYDGFKRGFDLVVAGVTLVLLIPIFLMLSILVAWRLGRPVLFRQTRIGLDGRRFQLVKFRSMTDARDEAGQQLPDAQRLTRFGQFLRATSLDELPELWNVIRGNLSLVGPRPLLEEYLPLYNAQQARRHDVRPGITGWAQVNGRNATTWEDRFDMDVWYVDNRSFTLDFRILCRTVLVVLRGSDVAAEGSVTMPKFTGSPVSACGKMESDI